MTRAEVLDYFDNCWALTEVLFSCLQGGEAFVRQPRASPSDLYLVASKSALRAFATAGQLRCALFCQPPPPTLLTISDTLGSCYRMCNVGHRPDVGKANLQGQLFASNVKAAAGDASQHLVRRPRQLKLALS